MYIGADNFQVLVLERNSWFKGKFTIKITMETSNKTQKNEKKKKHWGFKVAQKKNMGTSKALKYVDTRRSLAPCGDDSVSLYLSVIFQHYTANVKQNGLSPQ